MVFSILKMLYGHYLYPVRSVFITPKRNLMFILSLEFAYFWTLHIREIIYYVRFTSDFFHLA